MNDVNVCLADQDKVRLGDGTYRRRLPSGALINLRDIPSGETEESLSDAFAKAGMQVPPERIDVRPGNRAVVSVPIDALVAAIKALTEGVPELGRITPLGGQTKRY